MSWLKNRLLALEVLLMAALVVLPGCSGDSNSSSSTAYGIVQFYNASSGSPKVMFEASGLTLLNGRQEDWQVVAGYGSGGQRKAIQPDEYELRVLRLNAVSGEYDQPLLTQALTVADDVHQLVVLNGDFIAPELKTFTYSTNDNLGAGNFEFRALNFTSDYAQLEILYSTEGGTLEDATLHATIGQRNASEFEPLPEGRYVVYVVDADTGDLLLTTDAISFVRNVAYFLSVRDDLATGGVVVDQLGNNAFIYSYGAPQTLGQVRLYHSLEDLGAVDLVLAGDEGEATIQNVMADQFTPELALAAGSYSITVSAAGSSNQIVDDASVAVVAGQGRDIAIYRASDEVQVLDYSRELLTNAYESQVNIMSLADVRDEEDAARLLRFYLVPSDSYTGDPAVDKPLGIALTKMSAGKVVNATLTPDDYYVYVAYKSGEETVTIDNVSTVVDVEEDLVDGQLINVVSGVNAQLVFEPDTTQSSGYRLTLY